MFKSQPPTGHPTAAELRWQETFDERLLSCAERLLRVEYESDFATIGRIQSSGLGKTIALLRSLESGYRWDVLQLRLKQFHPRACARRGVQLTEEENAFLASFYRRHSAQPWTPPQQPPVPRKLLRPVVKAALESTTGRKMTRRDPGELVLSVPLHGWEVVHLLDFSGSGDQLELKYEVYGKVIRELTEDDFGYREALTNSLNYVRLLGFSSWTSWDTVTESDLPGFADSFLSIHNAVWVHFESFLAGLRDM